LPGRRDRYRIHAGLARDEIHRPCGLTLNPRCWMQVFGGKVTGRSSPPDAGIDLSKCRLESARHIAAEAYHLNCTVRLA
jgi:hypothetical protein